MVSELNIFVGMWSRIAGQKSLFFADCALQNVVEPTLPDGLETSSRRVYVFEFFHFGLFFSVL